VCIRARRGGDRGSWRPRGDDLQVIKRYEGHRIVDMLRATLYEDSDLVFATGKDTPLDAQNIVNRHFKPLLKCTGLPDIRWHDLRHTCATLVLLGRGVHPKLVQHLLWHASITMTLDRYSHWIRSMGEARCQRHGRGVGIESTADKARDTNIGGFLFSWDL
jgi:integrase